MKPLLDSKQICEILGISYRRYQQYLREDPDFPAYMIGGKWKTDQDELKTWIQNQETPSRPKVKEAQSTAKKRGRPLKGLSPQGSKWGIRIPD